MMIMEMRERLLDLAYSKEKEYTAKNGARQFACLIELIENDDIADFDDLAEYGVYK